MQPLILVVDDEPAIRDMLDQVLTDAGFAVSTAANGQEASLSIGDRVVDLVLTDILMPQWNGIDLIVELRKRRPGLPVIGMSGGGQLSREDCLKTARRVGAAAILAKPFTRSQLIATIDLVLPERSPLPG
jgi:DNA-binding NtrC family response regulator